MDTGSNVNIISKKYLFNLFPELNKLHYKVIRPSNLSVSSFTGHPVKILGTIDLIIKLSNKGKNSILTFHIFDDNVGSCPVVIGLSSLADLGLNISHKDQDGYLAPTLISKDEDQPEVMSYHLSEQELLVGSTNHIQLAPHESKVLNLNISYPAGITSKDKLLITSDLIPYSSNQNLDIIPTISKATFDPSTESYIGHFWVNNKGTKNYSGPVKASYEIVEAEDLKPLVEDDLKTLSGKSFLTDVDITHDPNAASTNLSKLDKFHLDNLNKMKICTFDVHFPESVDIRPNYNAENNGVLEGEASLSDSRHNIGPLNEVTPELEKLFQDKSETIQLGYREINDEEFSEMLKEERGYAIPHEVVQPRDLVPLDQYDEPVRGHIKRIFYDNYSDIIATHSLDRGRLSDTLGYYRINLKSGITLPKSHKVYYLGPLELAHLHSIIKFLIDGDVIEEISYKGETNSSYSSPAYLVPKANRNSSYRLVIDYKVINSSIEAEPAIIPSPEQLINKLRNMYFFTSSDLTNAFNSITIHPEDRDISSFSCPLGRFRSKVLPTGLKTSPLGLNKFVERMVHYLPTYDENQQLILDEEGLPVMKYAPMENVSAIFDDLLIFSELKGSYEESIDHHFKIVEELAKRLHFHKAKISMNKTYFCKVKVNFWGLYISHNFIAIDPKRIDKIVNCPLPSSKKQMRAFLGLINSLREYLNFTTLKHVPILSPLTSSKKDKFHMNEDQIKAFNDLKASLTRSPIFANIVLPGASKILFCDMATGENSMFSSVLAQVVPPKVEGNSCPYYLNLDDRLHQSIYDLRKMIMPIPIKKEDQSMAEYLKAIYTPSPPDYDYLKDEFLGYTKDDVDNSLGISLTLMYEVMQNKLDYFQLCKNLVKYIKTTLLRLQIKQFSFDNSDSEFRKYLMDIENGIITIDKKLYIFDALANVLMKNVIVLDNETNPVTYHNFSNYQYRAPIYFLLYRHKNRLIVRPGIFEKEDPYNLSKHKGTLEFCGYFAKTLPKALNSAHIMDLELYGILVALKSLRKLIGGVELLLITDSRPLYMLFSQSCLDSNVKISRWNHKVVEDYPNIRIAYIKSSDNLADFLTRKFDIAKPNMSKIKLPRYVSSEFDKLIDESTIFSLSEWKQLINSNPCMLTEDKPEDKPLFRINRLSALSRSIEQIIHPLDILRKRFTNEVLIDLQREEYPDLYSELITSKEVIKNNVTYTMQDNIILREFDELPKILLPYKLLPVIVAYGHLLALHSGEAKMKLNLVNYYHEDLSKYIRKFTQCCFPCQTNNYIKRKQRLGSYNLDLEPFEELYMDLLESFPPQHKYNHVLTVTCPISGYIQLYALKTKKSSEFLRIFLSYIYMFRAPKRIIADSGTVFLEKETLLTMASLNIQFIYSSSFNSVHNGLAESTNKIVKYALRKILTTEEKFDWVYSLPLICNVYNNLKSPRSGFSPNDIVYGTTRSSSFDSVEILPSNKLHYLIRNSKDAVEKLNLEKRKIIATVREKLESERLVRNEKINKNRIQKSFQPGELVLVKRHTHKPGAKKALVPHFLLSPYVVVKQGYTTAMVTRLSDQITQKLNLHDLKSLSHLSDDMKQNLPSKIIDILSKNFDEVSQNELNYLLALDDFELKDEANEYDEAIDEYEIYEAPPNKLFEDSEDPSSSAVDKVVDNVVDNTNKKNQQQSPAIESDEDTDSEESEDEQPYSSRLRKNPKKKVIFDL